MRVEDRAVGGVHHPQRFQPQRRPRRRQGRLAGSDCHRGRFPPYSPPACRVPVIKGLTAGKLLVIGLLLAVGAITILGVIYRGFTEDLVPLPTPTPVSSPAV